MRKLLIVVACWVMMTLSVQVCVAVQEGPKADQAIKSLRSYLKENDNDVSAVMKQPFATVPLTKEEAVEGQEILIEAWKASSAKEAEAELKANLIEIGDLEMKFFQRKFGEKPKDGWSLYISMHGGGGAPARTNDSQWRNQKKLYKLEEGIYVAPRAPTNTWNLWQQAHIDQFFDRLISDMIISEDVNPDRVYIMGYSAGGDGVYQLGPRLADRLAAAAMMAGHPGDAAAESLRNLPFTIHVGENDRPYKRNQQAAKWKKKLADLHKQDPDGYINEVEIHKGRGHWMKKEDAVAIPWMAKFTRNRFPDKVVWKQDNIKQKRFYWLAVNEIPEKKPLIVASIDGQKISIEKAEVDEVSVLVNDDMLDMDKEIKLDWAGTSVQSKKVNRTIGQLATSLLERGDPGMMFSARIEVEKPEGVVSESAESQTAKPEIAKPKAAMPEVVKPEAAKAE